MILQTRTRKGKIKVVSRDAVENIFKEAQSFNAKAELIQMLIPLGLEAVGDLLQSELESLAGEKHSRDSAASRWGNQKGSVYLGDEKFRMNIPRLRDTTHNQEIPLQSYHKIRRPRHLDENLMKKMLLGLSAGRYEECARTIPEAFGLSKSTVSRRYIRASRKKLDDLLGRRLDKEDIIAVFVDGKSFAEDGIILAVGVTLEGKKTILGFVQSASENSAVLKDFFQTLIERGFGYKEGLLFVVDGSKGIIKAIEEVFKGYALIQRCQWHKRENVMKYLSRGRQCEFKQKLSDAHNQPAYPKAKEALLKIRKDLLMVNQSAVASLDEGLEETLTLQRLGLFDKLGTSFKTTNVIESINARIGQFTDKVDYWKNSDQKQRWVAASLLDIEPRLRKVKGMRYLPLLRAAIKQDLGLEEQKQKLKEAA